MKKLRVRKNKILVEKLSKKPEKQSGLFVEAEVSDSQGTICHIGEDYVGDLKVGMAVYYGRESQQIRMTGKDVLVMDPENIIAEVVNEETQKA